MPYAFAKDDERTQTWLALMKAAKDKWYLCFRNDIHSPYIEWRTPLPLDSVHTLVRKNDGFWNIDAKHSPYLVIWVLNTGSVHAGNSDNTDMWNWKFNTYDEALEALKPHMGNYLS